MTINTTLGAKRSLLNSVDEVTTLAYTVHDHVFMMHNKIFGPQPTSVKSTPEEIRANDWLTVQQDIVDVAAIRLREVGKMLQDIAEAVGLPQ